MADDIVTNGCSLNTNNLFDAPMVNLRALRHNGWQLHTLTAPVGSYDIFRVMKQFDAQCLLQFAFGRLPNQKTRSHAVMQPVIRVQGKALPDMPCSGRQAFAITGVSAQSIRLEDRIVGAWFEDDNARYCFLGNISPQDLHQSPKAQAREVFEQIEKVLEMADMAVTDLVRTWLYLSRLLEWYDGFNDVRTRFFEERGVFGHLTPASTGIGADNEAGAALVAGALAIQSKQGGPRIFAVPSPMQCPAMQYRSAFSRAVEIDWHDARLLLISGTASITPDGRSAYVGDPQGQIELTMDVVAGILASRGMDWEQVTRMTVYVKSLAYAPLFTDYCRRKDIPPLPAVLAETDICRSELLFEIEADAVSELCPPHENHTVLKGLNSACTDITTIHKRKKVKS
jgi:enamine deaminase RidA (YjgF/YER057c/UK114 family)